MSTISRRAFLKTVGVGALSVAAVSVLAGCDKLPVNPETPVTGAVEAKVGQTYFLGDTCNVSLADGGMNPAMAATDWTKAYVKAVRGKVNKSDYTTKLSDSEKDALSASAVAAANKAAETDADAWVLTATFTFNSYIEDEIVIATGAPVASGVDKDSKSNTNVFSATCEGKDIACVVNKAVIDDKNASAGNEVKCFIVAPANFEELTLKVAVPGTSKVLSYKIENDSYVDIDDVDVTDETTYSTAEYGSWKS